LAHRDGSVGRVDLGRAGQTRALAYRESGAVMLRQLSPGEHRFFAELFSGAAPAAALAAAAAADPGFDAAGQLAWASEHGLAPPVEMESNT
jgi:hypothetical protein